MAEGADDFQWLVDVLTAIMEGPTWNQPIQQFIDDKCILFDNFSEENHHEYFNIHQEYKDMLDTLLAVHLSEAVDMDSYNFEEALEKHGLLDNQRLIALLAPMRAAEDFLTFKQMMLDAHAVYSSKQEGLILTKSQQEDQDAAAAAALEREQVEAVAAAAYAAEMEQAQAAAAAAQAQAAAAGQMPPPAVAYNPGMPMQPGFGGVVPAASSEVKPAAPAKAPTAQEERAFSAAGGVYGRAAMPSGAKKPASNEKSAAIRKALVSAAK